MPLDSRFLDFLCEELNSALCGAHIEKIHCPGGGEFVLAVKKQKLYISLSRSPFITLCDTEFINPDTPPMFCMLLRKHLQNGKITEIIKPCADRIVKISVQKRDEMGFMTENHLFFELFGGGNLILCNADNKIIDAFKKTTLEDDRLIMPGAVYNLPVCDLGFSPLILREAQHRNISPSELSISPAAVILRDQTGEMKDISYTKITQYGDYFNNEIYPDFITAVNTYYIERQKAINLENQKKELNKTVKNLIARNRRKLIIRKEEKEKSLSREQLRIKGELLKANLYKVQKGAKSVTVENFYDNMKPLEIALKTHLTPAKNADEYFKEYKKECTAAALLDSLIFECEEFLEYLYSVEEELSRVQNKNDIDEIIAELRENGIIRTKKASKKIKTADVNRENFEGFEIMYGKNNRQNEQVTLALSQKNDIWLHIKNYPGSHVVIKTKNKEVPKTVLEHAAEIALKNSGAASKNAGEVDYTLIKNVKKPQGAKCGHVIYKKFDTIYIKI
ncbi:MAG: NFACT family protein [Oscillospiraceae bacterium]|nr:NFACT family protein [Candidatus Equicaccousia limihippi]